MLVNSYPRNCPPLYFIFYLLTFEIPDRLISKRYGIQACNFDTPCQNPTPFRAARANRICKRFFAVDMLGVMPKPAMTFGRGVAQDYAQARYRCQKAADADDTPTE